MGTTQDEEDEEDLAVYEYGNDSAVGTTLTGTLGGLDNMYEYGDTMTSTSSMGVAHYEYVNTHLNVGYI